MYPVIRFIKEMVRANRLPALDLFETHHSTHICWPWDLDPWMELNNGRTLTLYDLGRIPMVRRNGMLKVLSNKGWGVSVAGASVRYRRRTKVFNRFTMTSRILGWDARFFYFQQSMWRKGEAASSILCRMAITDDKGIVAPARVTNALGVSETSPTLPDYVQLWIKSEAARPWPPE